MKKWIAAGLVVFQAFGASAFAGAIDINPTNTPEKLLLESLIALQGQKNLSQSELEAQVDANLTTYSQQASPVGQQARIEQAFVDLGIFTPTQAQSFVSDSQNSVVSLMTQAQTSDDSTALQSDVSATMNELAALHPVGAEFSDCADMLGAIGSVGLGGGIAALIAGGILDATGHKVGPTLMAWGGVATGVGAISLLFGFVLSFSFSESC